MSTDLFVNDINCEISLILVIIYDVKTESLYFVYIKIHLFKSKQSVVHST